MKSFCKLNSFPRVQCSAALFGCAPTAFARQYSRRSDSKNSDSPFKVVKGKLRIEDDAGRLAGEGGPNWELFAPRGNRFFMPGSLGPAFQGASTTIAIETPLDHLVDFNSKELSKLHVTTRECPKLLRKNLHELFPAPEVVAPNSKLTLITLSYRKDAEVEQAAKKFLFAAREICTRLRLNGHWADFMNPFSGRPFYSYSSGKNLYRIDHRFRGLGIKLESLNECILISSDQEIVFSGSVFTSAPSDLLTLQDLIME